MNAGPPASWTASWVWTKQEQRADFRREYLGFVFQSFHLVAYLTVIENVMLPWLTRRGRAKRAMVLEEFPGRLAGGPAPGEISAARRERAVARAIVNEPAILLADEPTGNLDSRNSREIMNMFQRLNATGMTIIMVTHSPECAGYARRILQMSDIVQGRWHLGRDTT
jgi:putative ABC transport system ATP-binding protein